MLRIRFRTSSTSGLLFLAAGQTDYFLLELHAGRLQVGTSIAPAHEHMCSSIHEHTHMHVHIYVLTHKSLCWTTHTHWCTDHRKLFLHLSWQCRSLNTVTQADKPAWCELSVSSIPVTSCHRRNKKLMKPVWSVYYIVFGSSGYLF